MLDDINAILTIAVLVIGAFTTAATWIIARIPTRRQVDEMRAELSEALDKMNKSFQDRIVLVEKAVSENIQAKIQLSDTEMKGKINLVLSKIDEVKKND